MYLFINAVYGLSYSDVLPDYIQGKSINQSEVLIS